MPIKEIERQAMLLADEHLRAEPTMRGVYWFPDDDEVRIVGLLPEVPRTLDGELHPYHFRPEPQDDLPAPSGVALIRPDEFGRLRLPRKWVGWDHAILLKEQE